MAGAYGGITRSGQSGNYTYAAKAGDSNWLRRPVNFVSFWDACRFANWLHNGQPSGAQDATTTEDGAYTLEGYTGGDGANVQRNATARYAVATEDEWYKAAYYEGGGTEGGYFDYPTGTDAPPSNDLIDPDPGNNANFYVEPDTYTIGAPYWTTPTGQFGNSTSPYGACDMAGNVWEWNEGVVFGCSRGVRGGSFACGGAFCCCLAASHRGASQPSGEAGDVGFRLVALHNYCLAVGSGFGDGLHVSGAVVAITAEIPPPYHQFTGWAGDTETIAQIDARCTTITMPDHDVSVTATYVRTYSLMVNNGSGGGRYRAGDVVSIQAGPAPSYQKFAGWTGETDCITDTAAACTTITMPEANVEIAATYCAILPGDLNVDGFVGQVDLDVVLDKWGQTVAIGDAADPVSDGCVNRSDLDVVLDTWGQTVTP